MLYQVHTVYCVELYDGVKDNVERKSKETVVTYFNAMFKYSVIGTN
jgi:hypothetical protein